jgi:glucuronate isomerase
MKPFLNDDFLLETETARELYHDHAADLPIFDYHCHLPPADIAKDRQFENITQIWLYGDHYKWRAMRTNGVPEKKVTGSADDRTKFQAFAETVPYTIGNPLYHWSHMELKRPFGISELLLSGDTAEEVWNTTSELLSKPEYSVRGIIDQMKVRVICTTDDPIDSLEHHKKIAKDETAAVKVFPAFRPDKAFSIGRPQPWNAYVDRLSAASDTSIAGLEDFKEALLHRIDYFHEHGARISDHALTAAVYAEHTEKEASEIFTAARQGTVPTRQETNKFISWFFGFVGREYAKRGWTMQLHIGALRSNNTRMYEALGPDTGFDSMADQTMAAPLAALLDSLDRTNELPRTILYNLNPRDNEMFATMIGNFQDGSVPGKIQHGSGWWFNDQKVGMEWQMTTLANMGLLSRFVGMLTDSRSFLSFPRHEYFRRVLCNIFGNWVERGEAPKDMKLLGQMVRDISYNNAVSYFGIEVD